MNLYQPTITGSLSVSGSVNISGSITIAGGGTISGTASIATTALTASSADNFLTRGTLTAQTLVVQTITSSVSTITGSTNFGSLLANTHVFTGSVLLSSGSSIGLNTSPTYPVDILTSVSSSQNIQAQFYNGDYSSGVRNFIRIRNNISVGSTMSSYFGQGQDGKTYIISNDFSRNDFVIDGNSGNVGIGTSSPTNPLHIVSNTVSQLNVAALSGNTNAQINLEPTGTGVALIGPASAFPLTFRTDATERMRITSGGNVGIGTTPSAWGSIFSGGVFQVKNSSLLAYNNNTYLSTNAYFTNSGDNYIGNGFASRYIQTSGQHIWESASNNTSGADAALTLVERMRITSGGNVGIGTSSPSSIVKLDILLDATAVNGLQIRTSDVGTVDGSTTANVFRTVNSSAGNWANARYNAYDHIFTTSGTTERMRITSGGSVAINNPSDKSEPLSVQGFLGNWTAFFQANTTTSNSYGPLVYGGSNSSDWALYVASATGTPYFRVRGDGATFVAGSLSKGSGSFRIKHPLTSKKDTHQLVHSFIEGPQADLIYRGKIQLINGQAAVNIDEASGMTEGTFEALCREVQCFTTNETGWDAVRGKVTGNILTIESQNTESIDEISWMVVGERQDEHMFDTEWTDENGKVIVEPLIPTEPENLMSRN